jgi:hypothetical protein
MSKLTKCEYKFGFTGTLDGTQTHKLVLEGLFGPERIVTTTSELIEQKHLAEFRIKAIVLNHTAEDRDKAIACFDLGEFARYFPLGRQILDQLKLKEEVIKGKNTDPSFDLRKMNDQLQTARDKANALLQGYDSTAIQLLQPLLLQPLDVGVRPTLGQGVDPTTVKTGDAPPPGKKPPFMWTPPKNPLKGK